METAFIIGSPRSGTTILGNILSHHPKIAEWYEPYYLWEKYFPVDSNDIWQENKINQKAIKSIHKEFRIFREKAKKPIILDKSPYHAFNIKIINKIFPNAKWIHIIRDGRDVTLSIKKEWIRRSLIVNKRDFRGMFLLAFKMLQRQPFLRYKIMAIYHEIKYISLNPLMYFNKSRWKGIAAWGPRFKDWEKYLQNYSLIEFNAMQWVKSVYAIRNFWPMLPEKNKIEISYENLLQFPEETLKKILDTLGIESTSHFFEKIPKLNKDNFHKWAKEFSTEELLKIRPILSHLNSELGYANCNE